MALDSLKHAAWILQRFILQGRRPYERRNQRRESLTRLEFHGLCTDRGRFLPRVLPTRAVVLVDNPVERPFRYAPLRRFQAGKGSVQIFRILEVLPEEGRRVRVVHHKCFEERVFVPALTVNHIVDDAAQKGDIRTGAHRRVDIRDSAGASEARIDMNDLGAVLDLGLHRPAKGYRVVFRHVGAHDHDTVGVIHASGVKGGRAAAESSPQTGDARAVSYPRLILDRHDAETAHALLMHVVELDFVDGAAEGENGGRHIDELAVGKFLDEGLVARFFDQLGDPVHRLFQVPNLPICRARGAMQYLGRPVGIDMKLEDGGPLGTKGALVVRAARIAFDVDDFPVDGVDERAASDGAIRADAGSRLSSLDAELLGTRDSWTEVYA